MQIYYLSKTHTSFTLKQSLFIIVLNYAKPFFISFISLSLCKIKTLNNYEKKRIKTDVL